MILAVAQLKFQAFFVLASLTAGFVSCQHRQKDNTFLAATKETFEKDTEQINNYLVTAFQKSNENEKLALLRKGIFKSVAINYSDGVLEGVYKITPEFFKVGKFDSCQVYYDIADKYTNMPVLKVNVLPILYLNHGTCYYLQGNYVAADSLYYKGIQLTNGKTELEDVRFSFLYNLYFTKNLTNQKKLALEYLNKAEAIARNKNDTGKLKLVLAGKSDLFVNELQLDSAHKYVTEAMSICKGDTLLDLLVVAGRVSIDKDPPEKAITLLNRAIAKAEESNNDFYRIELKIEMAGVYRKLRMYTKAVTILEPIVAEVNEKGFHSFVHLAYTNLANTYESAGDFKKALSLVKKLHAINDSLLNLEKVKTLNEFEVKYKTSEKDKQLALNNLELSQQQNKIVKQTSLILSISAIVALLVIFFFTYTRIKNHQINVMKQQEEINRLKAKMEGEETERQRVARDLHDGIGGLLSSALMHTAKFEEENPLVKYSHSFDVIKSSIRETAIDIRKTANNLMPDPIIKLGLPEAISQYCSSIRKPFSLDINVQTYGNFDGLDLSLRLTIYRIVQELLNNVIKHSHATSALVQVVANHDIAGITVEDDGTGIIDNAKRGMGLNNIQQRVENLGGKISILTAPDKGTAITIELPITNYS